MAASPAASSPASLKRVDDHHQIDPAVVSVDTLVNHLLVAKRSLSSMNVVLRANELATSARQSHEETLLLAAQTGFVRNSILDEVDILGRIWKSLQNTYDGGKRDFKKLVKAMDDVDADLSSTMDMLRGTQVQNAVQSIDNESKNLLDFVDETNVHEFREAMKQSIQDLQGTQQSFDGDLLRLQTDIRSLRKTIKASSLSSMHDDAWPNAVSSLHTMDDHSTAMASLLASLSNHFDMCVTAVRTTEGAAALARRKEAEFPQSQDSDAVSISGVIAQQESHMSDLEPKTSEDRTEMLKVVIQDAEEVDDVVQEIQERLAAIEQEHSALQDLTQSTKEAYAGVMQSFALLAEVGDRLPDYMAAEEDFRQRWGLEKEGVLEKLKEIRVIQDFYERYASAYSSLVLEVERRRSVDERVQGIWRKAQESVDMILDSDRASREAFRQDVGEYLPTDLWAGMQSSAKKWTVVQIDEDEGGSGSMIRRSSTQPQAPAQALDKADSARKETSN